MALTVEAAKKMRVADLRTTLKSLGLETGGLKQDLVDRLVSHLSGASSAAASEPNDSALIAMEIVSIDQLRECAVVRNSTDAPVSLAGCCAADIVGGNTSRPFPAIIIPPHASFTLWTAPGSQVGAFDGQEDANNVLWRNKSGEPRKQPVLNDEGDGLEIRDAQQRVIARAECSQFSAPSEASASAPVQPKSAKKAENGSGVSKSAKRKKKKRKKRELQKSSFASSAKAETTADNYDIDYVAEDQIDIQDPNFAMFADVFKNFQANARRKTPAEEEADAATVQSKADKKTAMDVDEVKKDEAGEEESEEEDEEEDESTKISNRKIKLKNRFTVAELKQRVERPDVVEAHDVTATDPLLLVGLKAQRNAVAVPRHWSYKRKYLQGKRGFEKPPFELPKFIRDTGIMEMREALQEKEERQSLSSKMREKTRPKMGKIDIDYQKLHDAFFRWQTKPPMAIIGDLYYEGKEFETKNHEGKPGILTKELKLALGMPTEEDAPPIPPPWLLHMQRYGPPPSYPNLKVPGLSAPIPAGANFGYHPGGWGKPPVDEKGVPIYGDVFGTNMKDVDGDIDLDQDVVEDKWGELESAEEESSEEEDSDDDDDKEEGEEDGETDAQGLATPSVIASESGLTSAGMDTPDAIELRKRKVIEEAMDETEQQQLYKVVPQKQANVGGAMMGSQHVYDIKSASAPGAAVEISVENPEDLEGLDQDELAQRYQQAAETQQPPKEDFSDMVAEHTARQTRKRKNKGDDKGAKKFKF